MPHIKVKL